MLKRILSQSYLIMMLAALLVGVFLPQARALTAVNTLILQIIFFISCLKIDPRSVWEHLKDWRFLVLANAVMLIGFPLVIWLLGLAWHSDFEFALFLLAAMPVGMTAPLLVEVAGGKQSAAMVLTVTTSLLAPFTIPLLTKLLYAKSVAVDASSMFVQLALVIFVPFIVAMIVKYALPRSVAALKNRTKPLSVVLLGLLITGAVAKQSGPILAYAADFKKFLLAIAGLYVFYLALHLTGYFVFWWKPRDIKQTASISLTYMNFTLAIFLASQFFPRPGILLPLVFSIIPWATFMPLWLKITKYRNL
jgi:predicted Na+-dependent transporter